MSLTLGIMTEITTLYAHSKNASELEVWRGSQEGLDVIIVNPGLILGDKLNNSSMKKIFEIANSNFFLSNRQDSCYRY